MLNKKIVVLFWFYGGSQVKQKRKNEKEKTEEEKQKEEKQRKKTK